MRSAELIVCEDAGLWAARLRQCHERFSPDAKAAALPLRRVTTWDAAKVLLERFPASALVLEMRPENVQAALDGIWACHTQHPQAVCLVVTERSLAAYEWPARELGAAAFFTSPRDLRPLVKLIQRHLASAPEAEMDAQARIWAELPWSE